MTRYGWPTIAAAARDRGTRRARGTGRRRVSHSEERE
nr:MAG TPA: hypothetical protein [Caudoviricetes sp.]